MGRFYPLATLSAVIALSLPSGCKQDRAVEDTHEEAPLAEPAAPAHESGAAAQAVPTANARPPSDAASAVAAEAQDDLAEVEAEVETTGAAVLELGAQAESDAGVSAGAAARQ
ncbi:hypothetical protein [Haliangium ochraceum]|uniref:Uncharacterized protein n=1 Tax=Haliangium ochraceum (strain DSM 14365 / JCM 11303 / SMP-2) TaxID=502025 RepID=D0LU06_HALO1|nr:hypothetical protein [Haliangium ochraceum]ACY17370.1 hypothetical protein Hoch_4881 [Haliangium ochraceum DSM 14365]